MTARRSAPLLPCGEGIEDLLADEALTAEVYATSTSSVDESAALVSVKMGLLASRRDQVVAAPGRGDVFHASIT